MQLCLCCFCLKINNNNNSKKNKMEYKRFLLIYMFIKQAIQTDVENLKLILQRPILPFWPSAKYFTNMDVLKLDEDSVRLGIEFKGSLTSQAIRRIVDKVLIGQNITMMVYGGSSSCGADLGIQSTDWTYHHFIREWWNYAIAPETGSSMHRQVIAVGGVGSTYFGHCWKEYFPKDQVIDLLIWEFFINDPDSENYGKGVEKFIRSILLYNSQPGLIFMKFFSKCPIQSEPVGICLQHNSQKNKLLLQLSKYYNVTNLNLFYSCYDYIHKTKKLSFKELFSENHPSHLTHAQMAYLFIYYMKQEMMNTLSTYSAYNTWSIQNYRLPYLVNNNINPPIPLPVFDSEDVNSICWSAILPDDRFVMPHSLFSLHVEYNIGFSVYKKHMWDLNAALRRDVRGGYVATNGNSFIRIAFPIDYTAKGNVYLSLSHKADGGTALLSVNSHHGVNSSLTIDCSRRIHSAQQVYYMGVFPAGLSKLTFETITGVCVIHAIIVE